MLPHSCELAGLQSGIRLYHLRPCRLHPALRRETVKNPRHSIAYTIRYNETVLVRVLHERMEIERQLEETL
jgi:plasmid stabilization system protein ParE